MLGNGRRWTKNLKILKNEGTLTLASKIVVRVLRIEIVFLFD
jgi:hypothetical protein